MAVADQQIDHQIQIGPRVRALREAMDLSLRDLAERSGVSAPMLSQVERGETSPDAGGRLPHRRGPRPPALPAPAPRRGRQRVHRPRAPSAAAAAGPQGHHFEILTPPLPGQRAELSRHVLAAGAPTGGEGDPPMHEPGSREIAVVERGTVMLHIDGAEHELQAGDTVTFDADLAHHFENPGPGEAVLLAVVSAGLRRS